MKNEGAKKARAKIKAFHHCLNSESLLPRQTYIPARAGFGTVFMANQVVALMTSHNYDPVPFCISQACRELKWLKEKPVFTSYVQILEAYLCQVSFFLKSYTEIEKRDLEYHIPDEYLNGGEREPPQYDVVSESFKNV